jgi:hypothetical protein
MPLSWSAELSDTLPIKYRGTEVLIASSFAAQPSMLIYARVPCQSASLIAQKSRARNTAQYLSSVCIADCLLQIVHPSGLCNATCVLDLSNARKHFTGMLSSQPMACIDRQGYNASLEGVAFETEHAVLYIPEAHSLPRSPLPVPSLCRC